MYERVGVAAVTATDRISIYTAEKAEIPYGTNKVYFSPDEWQEILKSMRAHGFTEDQLRFRNGFTDLELAAPHNEPKFMCQFVSRIRAFTITLDDAESLTAERSEDLSELRAAGRCVHRAELDNKPKFSEYAGPMWDGIRADGTAIIRYETWDVYDMMFD